MTLIQEIRIKIKRRHYEYSKHAVDQSIIRDISVVELEDAMAKNIEIIEDYPDDKYGPSCLILCQTNLEDHCIYSAAIRVDHSLRLSPYTNLILSCGSIFGSGSKIKEIWNERNNGRI